MPDMELESLREGVVLLEGGFAKRRVRTNPPPNPSPLVTGLTMLHGGVCRTLTPHTSGNKMMKKKKTFIVYFRVTETSLGHYLDKHNVQNHLS